MDYEKAYKELVGKIEKAYLYAQTDSTKAVLEEIRPELVESDDERIRKELIQFIKNWKDPNNIGRPHDFPTLTRNVEQCDRYIAWLEKQGDKAQGKSAWGDEEYNGEDYGIDSLYHAQRILEKTLGKVDGYQTDDGILSHKCAITAVKKLCEQKPKWSNDDEQYLLVCKNALRKYQVSDKWDADIISKWLEDKLKQEEEQNTKWTDEDEKKRKCLIKGLEDRMGFGWASDPFSREEYINWL